MKIFDGLGVALITPFRNGKVDFKNFENIVGELIDRDVDALIVCGSTGEPHSLTQKEKHELVACAVKTAKGKVPVIAGINQTLTEYAVQEGKTLFEAGADAFLAITPYCAKCTKSGLVMHYRQISKIGLPVIAYNVPSRTGYDMSADSLKELIDQNLICGIKQASATMRSTMEYLKVLDGKGFLYSGEDDLCVSMRALGAVGVISVAGLVIPEAMKAIFNLPIENAGKLQLELNGFINSLFCDVNPVPVKFALSYLGKCENSFRLPLTPLDEDGKQRIIEQGKRIGVFE